MDLGQKGLFQKSDPLEFPSPAMYYVIMIYGGSQGNREEISQLPKINWQVL